MKIIKFLLKGMFLSVVVTLFSCTGGTESAESVVIDVNEAGKFDFMAENEQASCIALDTCTEAFFTDMRRLYVDDEYVIIFSHRSQQILLFSRSGEFLRQIGTKGNSSGEYIDLTDVVYKDNCIYAFDKSVKKMIKYGLDGKVLSVINTEIPFLSFAKCDGGYWVYPDYDDEHNPDKYSLLLLDENLSEIKKGFVPPKNGYIVTTYPTFNYAPDGTIIFRCPSSVTPSVYAIEGDDVKEIFNPDFMGLPFLDDELISKCKGRNIQLYSSVLSEYAYLFDSKLYARYSFMGSKEGGGTLAKNYTVVYDSGTKSASVYKLNSMSTKDYHAVDFLSPFGVTKNGEMIFCVNPEGLKFSDEILQYYSKQCGRTITHDSNYIIVLYRPKK